MARPLVEVGRRVGFWLLSVAGLCLLAGAGLPEWVRVLLPAVVALVTIFFTRQAVVGLLSGAFAGCLMLSGGAPVEALKSLMVEHLFPSMQGPWRVGAILFTMLLGSFTVVLERSGGFESLAQRILAVGRGDPKRRLEACTAGLGCLCFFDGLANSLLIGRVTRPLADRVGVARAKMAYLVDSTSSSIACIAFISTWIATQLSLIQQSTQAFGIETSAYALFFASIPHNFYCLFTLVLMALVIGRRWDVGPMKRAQRTGEAVEETPATAPMGSVWRAIGPILVLSLSIVVLFYVWDTRPLWPVNGSKLAQSFSGEAGPYAMTLGALIGLLTAVFCVPHDRRDGVGKAVHDGAAGMLLPLLILVMAWTLGSVLSGLGTGAWLADALSASLPVVLFPAVIFVTGALVSFITGSSWGTMALLMPIALPAYLGMAGDDAGLLAAVIGAVFSGAVFGDHCSPFSDTTIISAYACGVSAREHVLTQLPYAGIAAAVALLLGYGGLALGLSAWVCLLAGSLALILVVCWPRRRGGDA